MPSKLGTARDDNMLRCALPQGSVCSCCKPIRAVLIHKAWLCRLAWKDADTAGIAKAACSLLDTLACLMPPHVSLHNRSSPGITAAASPAGAQAHETAVRGFAFALKHIMQQAEATAGSSKPGPAAIERVLPSLARALCVLLLPPVHTHGSGESSRLRHAFA